MNDVTNNPKTLQLPKPIIACQTTHYRMIQGQTRFGLIRSDPIRTTCLSSQEVTTYLVNNDVALISCDGSACHERYLRRMTRNCRKKPGVRLPDLFSTR